MGSLRLRKETGTLYFDFRFCGVRCREQTALVDTPANRRRAQQMLERIDAEITLGTFDYAKYFPNGKHVARFTFESNSALGMPVTDGGAEQCQSPKFEDFAEDWWKQSVLRWRKATQEVNRGVLDKYLIPAFGGKQVSEIRKADLLDFRVKIAKSPGRGTNATLSNKSINHHMGVLRMILVEAAEQHGFNNPFSNISALPIQKVHVDPFTLEETRRILDTVRADYRDYLTVRFFTGVRSGESDGLKWKYVDFGRRHILIRETYSKGRVESTKTDGSQRELEMSTPVYDALQRQFAVTGGDGPDSYVFRSPMGGPVEVMNFADRVWYPLLRYLGLRKRRPYQMRHTCATLWLAAGENPEWIARQLGHTTTEMLFRVYSRFVPNLTRKDGSAFEKLMETAGMAMATTPSSDIEGETNGK